MIRRASHSVDLLFTVSLFFVFAFCAVAVILLGADAYRSAAQGLQEEFSTHTAISYVSEKVRACGEPDSVSVEGTEDAPLLCLSSTIAGKEYRTTIYFREGRLCELFLPADRDFSPEAGQALLELTGFSARWKAEGLLEISCTGESGKTSRTLLYTRDGEKGGGL